MANRFQLEILKNRHLMFENRAKNFLKEEKLRLEKEREKDQLSRPVVGLGGFKTEPEDKLDLEPVRKQDDPGMDFADDFNTTLEEHTFFGGFGDDEPAQDVHGAPEPETSSSAQRELWDWIQEIAEETGGDIDDPREFMVELEMDDGEKYDALRAELGVEKFVRIVIDQLKELGVSQFGSDDYESLDEMGPPRTGGQPDVSPPDDDIEDDYSYFVKQADDWLSQGDRRAQAQQVRDWISKAYKMPSGEGEIDFELSEDLALGEDGLDEDGLGEGSKRQEQWKQSRDRKKENLDESLDFLDEMNEVTIEDAHGYGEMMEDAKRLSRLAFTRDSSLNSAGLLDEAEGARLLEEHSDKARRTSKKGYRNSSEVNPVDRLMSEGKTPPGANMKHQKIKGEKRLSLNRLIK